MLPMREGIGFAQGKYWFINQIPMLRPVILSKLVGVRSVAIAIIWGPDTPTHPRVGDTASSHQEVWKWSPTISRLPLVKLKLLAPCILRCIHCRLCCCLPGARLSQEEPLRRNATFYFIFKIVLKYNFFKCLNEDFNFLKKIKNQIFGCPGGRGQGRGSTGMGVRGRGLPGT